MSKSVAMSDMSLLELLTTQVEQHAADEMLEWVTKRKMCKAEDRITAILEHLHEIEHIRDTKTGYEKQKWQNDWDKLKLWFDILHENWLSRNQEIISKHKHAQALRMLLWGIPIDDIAQMNQVAHFNHSSLLFGRLDKIDQAPIFQNILISERHSEQKMSTLDHFWNALRTLFLYLHFGSIDVQVTQQDSFRISAITLKILLRAFGLMNTTTLNVTVWAWAKSKTFEQVVSFLTKQKQRNLETSGYKQSIKRNILTLFTAEQWVAYVRMANAICRVNYTLKKKHKMPCILYFHK